MDQPSGDIRVMEVLLSEVAIEVNITAGHMLKHKAATSTLMKHGSIYLYQQSKKPSGCVGQTAFEAKTAIWGFGHS